jgi:hypothetical protein
MKTATRTHRFQNDPDAFDSFAKVRYCACGRVERNACHEQPRAAPRPPRPARPSREVQLAQARELIASYGGSRAALKATHPDLGGDAAKFLAVQAARELLMNAGEKP